MWLVCFHLLSPSGGWWGEDYQGTLPDNQTFSVGVYLFIACLCLYVCLCSSRKGPFFCQALSHEPISPSPLRDEAKTQKGRSVQVLTTDARPVHCLSHISAAEKAILYHVPFGLWGDPSVAFHCCNLYGWNQARKWKVDQVRRGCAICPQGPWAEQKLLNAVPEDALWCVAGAGGRGRQI